MSNFQGNEPVIYKSLGQGTALKTENSLKWLQGKLHLPRQTIFFPLLHIFHYEPNWADKLQKVVIISEAQLLMQTEGKDKFS